MSSKLDSCFNFEIWISTILDNLEYFKSISPETAYSKEFVDLLSLMSQYAKWYEKEMQNTENTEQFDLSESVQYNGFRTFKVMFEKLLNDCFKFCQQLQSSRTSFLFMTRRYLKNLKHYVKMLDTLSLFLQVISGIRYVDDPQLLASEWGLVEIGEILKEFPFFKVALLHDGSNAFFLKGLISKLSSRIGLYYMIFADFYEKSSNPISWFFTSLVKLVRCHLDPELRYQSVFAAIQESSISVLTKILRLGEFVACKLYYLVPRWILPNLEIYEDLLVPDEPLEIISEDKKTIKIDVPSSHLPSGPVKCLLMSDVPCPSKVETESNPENTSLSSSLMIYLHGGGFVACRPEFNQMFLRPYAKKLKIPILCVDYSLSPEGPFPRPLEETLFVYVWALKNPERLGWTGERVYLMGDSAGGNICVSVTLKIAELNIRRPDGIFCFYSPMILDISFFPSRMIFLIDPLVPLQFLMNFLNAYIGNANVDTTQCSQEFLTQSEECMKRKSVAPGTVSECLRKYKASAAASPTSVQLPVYNHSSGLEAFKDYPIANLKTARTVQNPFLSPYLASDELLKKMCPVHFILGEFDAFLDENIAFGKRMKALGREATLMVLEGLPHGFLQSSMAFKDAYEGSEKCLQFLKDVMKIQ